MFGVVWESSVVLAAKMAEEDIGGRRVLEVGCGIGLASLVLHHRDVDITATDRHPEAEAFLEANAALNEQEPIPFQRVDWNDGADALGRFDLIIGSDLLYDRPQAELLASFVDDHANPRCEMILVDPGRGHAAAFARAMEARGFTHSRERAVDVPDLDLDTDPGPRMWFHSFRRG